MNAILAVILALAVTGCASAPPPLRGTPDLLNFLADGQTTKDQAFTTLGQPSGFFESERILTYRLGYDSRNRGYFLVERENRNGGWPTWTNASFSLVLVFDDAGLLRKHSLVKVNK